MQGDKLCPPEELLSACHAHSARERISQIGQVIITACTQLDRGLAPEVANELAWPENSAQ